MRHKNYEDFFGDVENAPTMRTLDSLGEISATATPAPGTPGDLDGIEDYDLIAVNLTAGQTYTFDFRGVPGGLNDPFLYLLRPDFSTITSDDDGGRGTSSQITYTATASGTYYLVATSFTWAAGGSPADDFGAYTINMWSPEADVPGSTNVLASIGTAVAITAGTTFGNMDVVGDNDYYAIEVTAGHVYSFNYSGGVSGAADRNGEAGENLARLTLYNADGTQISTNFNYESALSYIATTNTTIYLRAAGSTTEPGLGGTGGYTLDVTDIDPSTRDPLDAIRWKSANNIPTVDANGEAPGGETIYVYFAPAGVSYGQVEPDGPNIGQPMGSYGWQQYQIDGVMNAIQTNYTPITGIQYVRTLDESQAQLKLITTTNLTFGARFYPQDPANGSLQGVGSFNLNSGGFGTDPNSLLRGGFSYAVVLHEFGHAHGLAHPHDTGGGSDIMVGVVGNTGPASYGVYNLNQGVYTVMSYNDGWPLDPDGTRTYSAATRGSGWSGSLSAFDIAVLQERYGVHANATGNDTYTLSDTQAGAMYQCIWDTGGTDTIAYAGTKNVQIDLSTATLRYEVNGGGALSFAHGVFGGYTIANGVTIENATGGDGADLLIGNSANNVMTGNGGNDTLAGRTGIDTYRTGAGADTVIISLDSATVETKKGSVAYDLVTDFDGVNDKLDFSDLDAKLGTTANDAFKWIGTNANKNAGDLSYKVFDSLNGAEKALGIEIDNYTGAHSGKVTVVMANVDGGAVDYMVVLLGAPTLTADDFTL